MKKELEEIQRADKQGEDVKFEDIVEELKTRDEIDSNREVGPLVRSKDAYLLDTSNKSIEDCVDFIVSIVNGGNEGVL